MRSKMLDNGIQTGHSLHGARALAKYDRNPWAPVHDPLSSSLLLTMHVPISSAFYSACLRDLGH